MTCGIYCITNDLNGAKYIGLSKHIEKRWRDHPKGDLKVDEAIRKYGIHNFSMKIIEVLPNKKSILEERERYWIKKYDAFENPKHYNETEGGNLENMWDDPKFRAKTIKAMNGKKRSLKARKNMSIARRKQYSSKQARNRRIISSESSYLGMLNENHTSSAKRKISISHSKRKNKTGFYRVSIKYQYQEKIDGKRYRCYATTLEGLIKKMMDNGFSLQKSNKTNTGFKYCQKYFHYKYKDENGVGKDIMSVSISNLKEKVLAKGLEWIELDKEDSDGIRD